MAEKKSRKRSDLRFIHTVKFREQAPGLIFSKGPVWGPYFWRGLSMEGNLRFKIDWASLIVGSKFTVFALLCTRGQFSKYKPRGGLYLEGPFNWGFFALPVWGGLFSEFYGILQKVHLQLLKGMQSSKLGMWKGHHLTVEGIPRKKDLFYQKWYIKG